MGAVHPTAVVDGQAKLAADVEVGPYAVIRGKVAIGAGTVIGPGCLVTGPTRIGKDNIFYAQASIGGDSQDKKGCAGALEIGDGNKVREFCTLNRASDRGDSTKVGSRNWIMAYSHVAHDCEVGDDTVIGNLSQLGGHVSIGDSAILGGGTLVHQFCRVGRNSIIGGGNALRADLPPYGKYATAPNRISVVINKLGLERAGLDANDAKLLAESYRLLYQKGLDLPAALKAMRLLGKDNASVRALIDFLAAPSKFGIVYPRRYNQGGSSK